MALKAISEAEAAAASKPRTVAFPFVGTLAGGASFNVTIAQDGTLLASGQQAYVGANPTSTETLTLNTVHGGAVTTQGTISVATSGAVTWPSYSDVALLAGDTVQIVNQATADATFGSACLSLAFQPT